MITVPFGNASPSAATRVEPSGRRGSGSVSRASSPPYMSKPKLPTYARPRASTTMSLHWPVASADRSACSTSSPSSSRSTRRSSIDTTSMRPSGSQPRPDGCSGTSTTVSALPLGSIATTRWSCWSLKNEPALVPARPFGKREAFEHDLGVALGHGCATVLFGRPRVSRAHVVEAAAGATREAAARARSRRTARRSRTARSPGRSRPSDARARRRCTKPSDRPDHADHAEQPVRRAARLGGEELDAERAERDAAGARRDDRRRPPSPRAARRRRGRRPSASRSRSASAIAAIGRRPRTSASRPPSTSPKSPGMPVVTVRNSAMPLFE